MSDLENEIRALKEKTARTRHQFLQAELQTLFTALDMAKYELSVGNAAVVEREVDFLESGLRTVQRFVGEEPAEQRREIEGRIAEVKAALEPLKAHLALRRAVPNPN